jgi:hypothetical protein
VKIVDGILDLELRDFDSGVTDLGVVEVDGEGLNQTETESAICSIRTSISNSLRRIFRVL